MISSKLPRFRAATAFAAFLGLAVLAPVPAAAQAIAVELVYGDLHRPVYMTSPPGDPRLFVVEQHGTILIIEDGQMAPQPFLDLSALVEVGPEQGLLGLAFHPGYASNGQFFVNYTDAANRTQIVEYRVSANANVADPGSARNILTIQRPTWRHNGGWMAFGPDGLLYVSSGDGGGTNDPNGHGQNRETLMATIFRLDVDRGGDPEVVAWGLRNPWRASFDGNWLYLGDVGQDTWEEIDVFNVGTATNFGWSIMEGPYCYLAAACDQTGLTAPYYAYTHQEGCSVVGGYVYRGRAIPELTGHYFLADWCSGFVRSIHGNGEVTDWTETIGNLGNITSFGVDAAGELYIVVQNGRVVNQRGALYRIVPR